ncbi:MAG: hypothetical protein GX601_08070 [Anaerolineales bacterium]|nr:hypothetical protein [Anaerolineales bacterium]
MRNRMFGPSNLRSEREQPQQPPADSRADVEKFTEPRGWAVRWCGVALSDADRDWDDDSSEEEEQ